MTRRIALATCVDLPDWEVDDEPLREALRAYGAEPLDVPWDADVAWGSFDACLIRTTWDYWNRHDEFVAWAERAERETLLQNPAAVVRWNTHKGYLRHFEEQGIELAPTVWVARGQSIDVARTFAERGWTRGFVKPQVGASASGTLRFDADANGLRTAQAHVDDLLAAHDLMLQPYLASVETEGELSAIWIDGEVTHGVRKVPVPGDYRVQDDYGAHDEPFEFDADERALVDRVLAAIPFEDPLLYARVDFLRDGDGRLTLNELEVVEPSLFFRHGPGAAARLASSLLLRVETRRSAATS